MAAMDNNQLIFYSTPRGTVKVKVIFEEETFWLSQKRMAELFGVDVRTVNEHLKNIFKTGELREDSVIRNFRTTGKVTCFWGIPNNSNRIQQ